MSDALNPYEQWLGVASPAGAKPNHYELLGVAAFESDPQAIAAAASVQSAKVRGIRPGANLPIWRRVLDELDEARRCLTNAEDKARYDEELRKAPAPTATREPAAKPQAPATPRGERRTEPAEAAGRNVLPPRPASKPAAAQGSLNPLPPKPGSAGSSSAPAAGLNPMPPKPGANQPAPTAAPVGPAAPIPAAAAGPSPSVPAPQFPSAPVLAAQTPPQPTQMPQPQSGLPAAPIQPSPYPQPGPFPQPAAFQPQPPGGYPQGPGGYPAAPQYPQQPQFPGGYAPPGMRPPTPYPAAWPAPAPQQPYGPASGHTPGPAPQMPGYPTPYPGSTYPQQMPGAMPYGMPGQQPGAMPGQMPQSGPPGFGAAPQLPAPTTSAGGGAFFDNLLDDSGPSPLDEFGISSGSAAAAPSAWPGGPPTGPASPAPTAERPTVAQQSVVFDSHVPAASSPLDLADGASDARPRGRSTATSGRANSSRMIMFVVGGVAVLLLVAGGIFFATRNRSPAPDALADALPSHGDGNSDGRSTTSPVAQPKPPAPVKPTVNPLVDPNKKPPTGNNPADHHPQPQPVKPQPDNPKAHETPPTPPPMPEKPPVLEMPKPAPEPAKPAPESRKPAPADPAKLARLRRTLASARAKLSERNLEEAKKMVEAARSEATSQDQQNIVDRTDALVKYVGEFWGAVHDAVNALKATDEIDVGTSKVVIVDKSADSITIHVGGQNRHFELYQLPSGLAVALAWRALDEKNPKNKVFIGAFFAVDPKSDPQDAKKMWDEAIGAGVSEAKFLLPLLQPEPADTAMASGDDGGQLAVPDANALAKVEEGFKREYESAYLEAINSPKKKGELAKKLVDEGDSAGEPVKQYLMWREARDLAADAGQPAIMSDAIDHMARQFKIDPLDMKADTLTSFPARNPSAGKAINAVAMSLIDEAVAVKRYALADRFDRIAVESAHKANNSEMAKRAVARGKEVQALMAGDSSQ